jgi:malonyl CoA-acyl carrier protein transacylase
MKILIMFGGQGTQSSDLFQLVQSDEKAMSLLNALSTAAQIHFPVKSNDVGNPKVSQFMIAAYQLTLFSVLSDLFQNQQIDLAGYSLGEVCACLASANASPQTAMDIIKHRTQLMTAGFITNSGNDYDLLSIRGRFDLESIKQACDINRCAIAIINSDSHLIIGGQVSDLNQFLNYPSNNRIERSKFLSIQLPSHTPFYSGLKNKFSAFLNTKLSNSRLQYPIISPLELSKTYSIQDECHLLDRELYTTLNWQSVCHLISEYGYEIILDLGPGSAMSSLLKEAAGKKLNTNLITASDFSSIRGIRAFLSAGLLNR